MDLKTDAEGYLLEPEDWSAEVARELAAREGVELTDEHWDIMRFMRAYLHHHKIAPDVRHVMKHLKEKRGAGRNRVFELFPYGYVQQACKIAGMRRPRAWSTG
ncbi:MAG: TusE/DsrC/DsvC family sulfur relay protein [Rhodospirillales bacterium]|nr:MAG: TusE/DsrC/DsvC family sulfur relay protein [Rhodospirillales bacterium]